MLDAPDIAHRGAALLYQGGTIEVESHSSPGQPDSTTRVAIFLYGKPVIVETAQQRGVAQHRSVAAEVEPAEAMADWEPGAKDIGFPGFE